jgi:hypothetical protein
MNAAPDPTDPLAFPPPTDARGDAVAAERESLKFPARFLKKARELKAARDELREALAENSRLRDRLDGFVVRHLIAVVDNCRPVLAAANEDGPASPEALSVASVYRAVLHLLEELGAVPVELLGRTYTDVTVDGQTIDDPFDVIEAEQKGKTADVRVSEVIHDLWVRRSNGRVEVLRRGKVNC